MRGMGTGSLVPFSPVGWKIQPDPEKQRDEGCSSETLLGCAWKAVLLGLVNHLHINQTDWFSNFLAGWGTNQLRNRHKVTWSIKKPDVANWHSLAKWRFGLRPRACPLQAPASGAAVSSKPCSSDLRCCHRRSAMLLYKSWPPPAHW